MPSLRAAKRRRAERGGRPVRLSGRGAVISPSEITRLRPGPRRTEKSSGKLQWRQITGWRPASAPISVIRSGGQECAGDMLGGGRGQGERRPETPPGGGGEIAGPGLTRQPREMIATFWLEYSSVVRLSYIMYACRMLHVRYTMKLSGAL